MNDYMKNIEEESLDPAVHQLVDPAAEDPRSKQSMAFMEEFFQEIEKAKTSINAIKQATATVKGLNDEALAAIGQEEEALVSDKLQPVLSAANKEAALAKRGLEHLKTETEKISRKDHAADIRVRENIHATTLQNLVVTVRAYQAAQNEYKSSLQEKGRRQIKVVKPTATEEEVTEVMQTGDVNAIIREALLQPGSDPIAQAYLNVVDKYQDVLRLEKSVTELHQMFVDLAILVEHQGEMLNNIEHQVATSKEYVKSGNAELVRALKARKQTRRRMCCFIVCLIIVMVIILGPVLNAFS